MQPNMQPNMQPGRARGAGAGSAATVETGNAVIIARIGSAAEPLGLRPEFSRRLRAHLVAEAAALIASRGEARSA
jgi:hypothetical protein